MSTLLNKTDGVQQAYDKMIEGLAQDEYKFSKKKGREFKTGTEDSAATSGSSSAVVLKQLQKIPEYAKLPQDKQREILAIFGE